MTIFAPGQPRVLILADAYPSQEWTTANPFIRSQALALKRLGCDIAVFAPVPYVPPGLGGHFAKFAKLPAHDVLDGITVDRPRFPRGPGAAFRGCSGPIQRVWLRRAFERVVRRFQPTILHAHMATPAGYLATRWAGPRGLPVCVSLHGLDLTSYPTSNRKLHTQTVEALRRADRVIAVSRFISEQAVALVEDCVPHICYTGIDTLAFSPNPLRRDFIRERLKLSADLPVLCMAGRMVHEKGLDDAVAIAATLQQSGQMVAWMLVGDGPALSDLRNALARYVGEERVLALGDVPPEDMPDYLRAADVLVHLSLNEGFGMAVLEAQACGTPVVAYDVGGIPEAVSAGNSAILIDADANIARRRLDFAANLTALINDRDRINGMSWAGVAFAENFAIDKCAQKLHAIYLDLQR